VRPTAKLQLSGVLV